MNGTRAKALHTTHGLKHVHQIRTERYATRPGGQSPNRSKRLEAVRRWARPVAS